MLLQPPGDVFESIGKMEWIQQRCHIGTGGLKYGTWSVGRGIGTELSTTTDMALVVGSIHTPSMQGFHSQHASNVSMVKWTPNTRIVIPIDDSLRLCCPLTILPQFLKRVIVCRSITTMLTTNDRSSRVVARSHCREVWIGFLIAAGVHPFSFSFDSSPILRAWSIRIDVHWFLNSLWKRRQLLIHDVYYSINILVAIGKYMIKDWDCYR